MAHLLLACISLCLFSNTGSADSLAFSGVTAHLPGTIDPATVEFMPNRLDSTGTFVYNLEALYTKEMSSIVIKGGYLKDSFNDNAALLVESNKDFIDEKNMYLGYGGGIYVRETFKVRKGNVEYRGVSPCQISNGYYDLLITPGILGGMKLNESLSLELTSNILLNNVSLAYTF